MRIFRFIAFFVVGSFLNISCGNNTNNTNSTVQEGASGGNMIVHVTDGDPVSQPMYSWEDLSNNTMAEKISVARTSALNTPVWGVQSVDVTQNLIQSPWQQGTSGGSVSVFSSSEVQLQSGIEYRVTITEAGGTPSGYINFTITQ